jgi:hypothetical protein
VDLSGGGFERLSGNGLQDRWVSTKRSDEMKTNHVQNTNLSSTFGTNCNGVVHFLRSSGPVVCEIIEANVSE